MNDGKITICDDAWTFGCNKCFICDTHFRHSTVTTKYADGLEEVELRFIHARCARSAKKIAKLKGELLNAEFNHFCLKFNQII